MQRGLGAIYRDFPAERTTDLWTWNVNGINSVMTKGNWREFLSKNNPTVICLNEIKTSPEKIDEAFLHTQVPNSYL